MNMFEEVCECGTQIPRGYGYYNYGRKLRCYGCGKYNQEGSPSKQEISP